MGVTVNASLSGPGGEFLMETTGSGWSPSISPSPSSFGPSRKSGLVVVPIFGRVGDAGQDTGAHSRELTVEGLALKADVDILDAMTIAPQISEGGEGVNTFAASNGSWSIAKLGIKSYITTTVEGSELLYRYTIQLIQIEAPA
jgi:hypothetical protein